MNFSKYDSRIPPDFTLSYRTLLSERDVYKAWAEERLLSYKRVLDQNGELLGKNTKLSKQVGDLKLELLVARFVIGVVTLGLVVALIV